MQNATKTVKWILSHFIAKKEKQPQNESELNFCKKLFLNVCKTTIEHTQIIYCAASMTVCSYMFPHAYICLFYQRLMKGMKTYTYPSENTHEGSMKFWMHAWFSKEKLNAKNHNLKKMFLNESTPKIVYPAVYSMY